MKFLMPFSLFVSACLLLSCHTQKEVNNRSVKNVVDDLVTKFYAELKPEQLDTIREDYILSKMSDTDQQVLSSKYLTFDVNVPVTVSLMRHVRQKVVPFWLPKSGFVKTSMLVKNEEYTYEVWQKDFDAGQVGLGINGFDKDRPVYFICVAPKTKGNALKISNVFPKEFQRDTTRLTTMRKGAFTYHDWDTLVLTELPESLDGQVLFTTIRGRAREAHLVKAFRKTAFPSSPKPDQLLQTWSGDPKTTLDIQWRTSPDIIKGDVKYWKNQTNDTLTAIASSFKMEDRLLENDRYITRHTSKLSDLKPGTLYHYKAGSDQGGWSAAYTFKTEDESPKEFSYIWFGDTHHSDVWGNMARKAALRHPEVAFYSIAGDLVSIGLDRNEWDDLWKFSGDVFASKPLMAVPGNHDSQDGLGAWMYQEMFSYPQNGPKAQPREMTYSFEYGNALFLQIDATLNIPAQTSWIETQLKNSKAKWKFVMFHFSPYNFVEPYDEIVKEWGTLFDKYHVDMMMGGHMHYYLRTKPIFNGKTVDDPAKGTIYTMSISIEGKQEEWPDEDYAVKRYPDGPLYQHLTIIGNKLFYKCLDPEGNVKDELVIEK